MMTQMPFQYIQTEGRKPTQCAPSFLINSSQKVTPRSSTSKSFTTLDFDAHIYHT